MPAKKYESTDELPDNIRAALLRFVSSIDDDVFVLRNLPLELSGGLLARYSRAPTGLRLTLVNEFLNEEGEPIAAKGTELVERVLVGFGDDSVGELEGAHVGFENVSQLFTKDIEDRRIGGSPIEQSTRYVRYDQKDSKGRWRYLRPIEIAESGFLEKFESVTDSAFEVYSEGIKRLTDYFKLQFPRNKFKIPVERNGNIVKLGEEDLNNDEERKAFRNSYNFSVRCAALDFGRCVLPSSALTQLGLFANGRYFTNLITFLKSTELSESNKKGAELEQALMTEIPTFIRRNKVDPRVKAINLNMHNLTGRLFLGVVPDDNYVTLVPRSDYINEVVSSVLFPYTNISIQQILLEVEKMPLQNKLEILNTFKGIREERRDRSGRGLEAGYPIVFDLVGGFAEYRDLERHRMLTQQRQQLSVNLGFIMPQEISEVDLENEVAEVEGRMSDLYSDLKHAGLTTASQYATLFNHRIRFMMGMNLREFQHLSELRTTPAGHFSYRAMVMEMVRQLKRREPWSERFYEFVDYSDPDNKIARAQEQSKIAGKSLTKGLDMDGDLE
ncbi:FAD-dependent thymidylate synthase [Candidatus Pacearchaeota archaeon]|nr:FAD-dependent thymidylate synthase [Candidatus Pacearchaeota archaeon]